MFEEQCSQLPLPHPPDPSGGDVVRATLIHHASLPPVLQKHNQTLNAPYKVHLELKYKLNSNTKDLRLSCGPSDRIGSCYSPAALRLRATRDGITVDKRNPPRAATHEPGNQLPVLPGIPSDTHFTPSEQCFFQKQATENDPAQSLSPSKEEEERYNWYLEHAFDVGSLVTLEGETERKINVRCGIETDLPKDKYTEFMSEVKELYQHSLKQSILDYVLLDPGERSRLGIEIENKRFESTTIQGPCPWTENIRLESIIVWNLSSWF
eukprot:sb/3468297/